MISRHLAVVCFASIALWGTTGKADLIADFTADYQFPTPASGWAYLWNQNGAINDLANNPYVALVPDTAGTFQHYGVTANGTIPDGSPGSYANVSQGMMHPGEGFGQNAFERYVIAAYTLSTSGFTSLANINVVDADLNGGEGVSIYWAVDNVPALPSPITIGNGGSYSSLEDSLGFLNAGQTIYFAIGSRNDHFYDGTQVQFQITQVPEPSSWLLMGLGSIAMAWKFRRRWATRTMA